ncbi:TetR family transcriptional regulator [Leptospira licerasiae]|nr:TetR family transcriptional regulator [Leptospira licerasiae]
MSNIERTVSLYLTIEQVALVLGSRKHTIYRRFGSKSELF